MMRNFITKIIHFYLTITTLSICIYFFTKHNLTTDFTAKTMVHAFSTNNLAVKHEIAEERRVVFQNIIRNKGKHYQNLIIGSSRVMQFGNKTGFKNSLNLGVSGANLKDITYIYDLTQENNITYDTIIFDFNPWLLIQNDNRYKQFENFHIAKTAFYDILKFNYDSEDLLSLIGLFTNYHFSFKQATTENINSHSNFIKFTDGSIQQKKLTDEQRQKQIESFTKNLYQMHDFFIIDTILFNQTIQLFQTASKFGKCLVTLTPFHQRIYIEKHSDIRIKNIALTEKKLFETKRNFGVLGSFNPIKINVVETDFIDGFHLKESAINKLFTKSSSFISNQKHQNSN